jgi:hypothetical protein
MAEHDYLMGGTVYRGSSSSNEGETNIDGCHLSRRGVRGMQFWKIRSASKIILSDIAALLSRMTSTRFTPFLSDDNSVQRNESKYDMAIH